MTEQAQRALQKAEKKRFKEEMKSGGATKKQKTNGGPVAAAAAVTSVGTKPIFIQPPNLSTDCVLKDYQLEGVRWLASLFENGVSGILADGMCLFLLSFINHILRYCIIGMPSDNFFCFDVQRWVWVKPFSVWH